jgi:lipopolysaccharide transport system ATP-binding protein
MGSITVTGLGKAYKRYAGRWSRLAEWLMPFKGPRHTLHWILHDISFRVEPGEAVGIIGINGAGKSTLLKLITGTTQPTTGNVQIRGRVAALLELGMGFHPDFTGRQNVFMAGQLLGLVVDEIAALMPEIEAFAEIGEYIDQPVRVYSSGMQVRLAFAVATARRPDLLIVDEALAVGDVYFQQKCFDRIRSFTEGGTTLLFVTHSLGTVLDLCSRALYLSHGSIAHDGQPSAAVDLFQADMLGRLDKSPERLNVLMPCDQSDESGLNSSAIEIDLPYESRVHGRVGSIVTNDADCIRVRLLDGHHQVTSVVIDANLTTLEICYRVNRDIDDPHVGFKIRNRQGVVLFETNTYCMGEPIGHVRCGEAIVSRFYFRPSFLPDEYTVTVGLGNRGFGEGSFEEVLSYLHEVLAFSVIRSPGTPLWSGLVNLHPTVDSTIVSVRV